MKKQLFTLAILMGCTVSAFANSSSLAVPEKDGIVIHTSCGTTFTLPREHIKSAEELGELALAIDELDCGQK